MGIQINGQTDRISAVDGSFSIQDLAEVNVTGVATASNLSREPVMFIALDIMVLILMSLE